MKKHIVYLPSILSFRISGAEQVSQTLLGHLQLQVELAPTGAELGVGSWSSTKQARRVIY
jgi:hypothetical protein